MRRASEIFPPWRFGEAPHLNRRHSATRNVPISAIRPHRLPLFPSSQVPAVPTKSTGLQVVSVVSPFFFLTASSHNLRGSRSGRQLPAGACTAYLGLSRPPRRLVGGSTNAESHHATIPSKCWSPEKWRTSNGLCFLVTEERERVAWRWRHGDTVGGLSGLWALESSKRST